MPTACHHVPYVTMEELENIASQRKKSVSNPSQGRTDITTQDLSQQELEELYKDLNMATDRKPAILSLITPSSDRFTQSSDHLPPHLQGLYEPENLHLNYLELITKFKDVCKQPITEAQWKNSQGVTLLHVPCF